ncbi:SulP family inorganic anion transporter [Pseudohongiella sp.]|uniref:STAS domain-containing protein n=1 Tax=marine sediment metagenome TaxID=412755 RepID=A0A0F9VSJ4_9ZZZZ|nr:SulP family inorganic anion transporter [Pseudohongiella sp.]
MEVFAGLVGAILVIPQGITFAYLAGLPPEYGLYCAIFVTLFCSLLGSSSMMSGPNTAVAILIGTAVLPLAGRGSPLYIDFVFLLCLMVGLIQLMFWLARGARIFQYLSPASISGISAGAGFLIIMSSLDSMLDLSTFQTTFFYEKLYVIASDAGNLVNPYSLAIGLTTIASGYLGKRYSPRYFIIIAVTAGYLCGVLVAFVWPQPITELEYLGRMPLEWLPLSIPNINIEYLMISTKLIPYAIAIAFIGLAQSLVIVRELKMETDQDINLDKEVYAQGMANFLAPFFSGFAGAGSFNRTRANQSLGATTPLSGITAAGFVLILITFLGPILTFMPMAAMSGTLFIVGANMIKWRDIKHYAQVRSELIIYFTTFLCIMFFGLAAGVAVAVVLSVSVFMLHISQLELKMESANTGTVLKVKGALFYASVAHLTEKFHRHLDGDLTVDLQYTTHVDQSAVDFFIRESRQMAAQGTKLTLLINDEQRKFLERLGASSELELVSL